MPARETLATRLGAWGVDDDNQVVVYDDVGGAFAARMYDATRPGGDAVIGQPLLNYVSDAEAAHVYQVLLQKLRKHGAPIRVPFRCDSTRTGQSARVHFAA